MVALLGLAFSGIMSEGVPIDPIGACAAFLNLARIFHSALPQPLCQPIEIPCRANSQPGNPDGNLYPP
ncbi:hypothetical protein [Mesorhizobium sp. LSJC285A00]|jgi:hypothetical protein|uniref:hypothetical protein n=1 Tax=Mesorhizobium sp. LSJC285A00 TaxID=1287338 RepID=UPI000A6981C9|nr:hypothetical protein [Mesorhizobium sp. LSJC285A00]